MREAAVKVATGSSGAWLRLIRLSNAPTAVTGVMVGAVAGTGLVPAVSTMVLCAAGSAMLYSGGMVMNDYFDQPIDRIERPARPIVSGEVRESAALLLGMGLLGGGVVTLVATSAPALPWILLLVSSILAYNLLHRSHIAGPLLMATCRALVPVIAAVSCAPEGRPNWVALGFFALPLALHTSAISIAARHEAERERTDRMRRVAIASAMTGAAALAPLGALAMQAVQPMHGRCAPIYLGAMVLTGWLLLRGLRAMANPVEAPRGVMSWIAAIAAVDAASLALLDALSLALIALVATGLTLLLQRRIAGS